MSYISLYLLHSLSPMPQIEFKCKSQPDGPISGNDLCAEVFSENDFTRHKKINAFSAAVNPIKSVPTTNTHPNWKVDPYLEHVMRALNECRQDIDFQGQHQDKSRNT